MTQTMRIDFLAGVALSGPDAVAFARAQLTSAVPDAPMDRWAASAWCDPKGRALVFLLFRVHDSGVILAVPENQAGALIQRMRPYTIGRKVEFSQPLPLSGVRGNGSGLAPGLAPLAMDPARALGIADNPDVPAEEPDNAWLRDDLCCALPWLHPDTAGRFLPQMLGLEALGGLDYHKGCFPGQEVIARVHYRGRVTRHALGFQLEGPRVPAPGTPMTCGPKESEATVLYAMSGDNGSIGLGVFPAETEPGWQVSINDTPGKVVEPGSLSRDRFRNKKTMFSKDLEGKSQ